MYFQVHKDVVLPVENENDTDSLDLQLSRIFAHIEDLQEVNSRVKQVEHVCYYDNALPSEMSIVKN